MAKKRDIFAELMEGFQSLADERLGKIALRTYVVEVKPLAPRHERRNHRRAQKT